MLTLREPEPMTPRLIYVVGASGSGKDSLMGYARNALAHEDRVAFAHRYITRTANAGGENHVALSPEEFESRRKARLFAMHWGSHDHCYGIGIEINQWLAKGITVVVNGSREYLAEAAKLYPELAPVWIEASPAVLQQRLEARGRENADQIQARLERNAAVQMGAQRGTVICNDGALHSAGDALVQCIRATMGAVPCV